MNEALRAWRESQGLTVTEAAERSNVTPAMWSRWENGRRRIPAERVILLQNTTGIPRHELRPDLYDEAQPAA